MGSAAAPLPSFPRKRESGGGWAAKGWSFQYRRDSRLRGNDGRGAEMTVGGVKYIRLHGDETTAEKGYNGIA